MPFIYEDGRLRRLTPAEDRLFEETLAEWEANLPDDYYTNAPLVSFDAGEVAGYSWDGEDGYYDYDCEWDD